MQKQASKLMQEQIKELKEERKEEQGLGRKVQGQDLVDDEGLLDPQPMTAQEAAAWRANNPGTSPWRVLALQVVGGAVLVALTLVLTGAFSLAASVAWGVVAVCLPAAVFARALSRSMRQRQAGSALAGFFFWELVKIVLTVALLLVAPKVVADLSWLALLAGFVLTMKMYWLAMVLHLKRRSRPTQV